MSIREERARAFNYRETLEISCYEARAVINGIDKELKNRERNKFNKRELMRVRVKALDCFYSCIHKSSQITDMLKRSI